VVPVAGSAYTYGYATLGELFAWIIGWDLVLEYALAATTVAIGWSGYVVSLLNQLGIAIPPALTAPAGATVQLADGGTVTALFNLPAVLITLLITALLVVGIQESAKVNNVVVVIKVAVVLAVIFLCIGKVNPANWQPFIPANTGAREAFGLTGIISGAGVVFFAYIGFDAVSTAAQEAKNPQRDMPIGILGSLLICTVLYMVVSAIATGVVPYQDLNVPDPIAKVADVAGLGWFATLIKVGAIAGLTSVILVQMMGQTRVFYSMSRDGLLPRWVNAVHPRFRTPWLTTIAVGIAVTIPAGFLTVSEAAHLVSIGTLLAFAIVSAGVIVLRLREPNLHRPFRTPLVWFVAPMGVLSSLYLMYYLPRVAWERLGIWLAIGLAIYFLYGVRHSRLARQGTGEPT
jgi:APA family basic amino acid/polyamine antiporter